MKYVQKLRENRKTIQKLTSQLQEMQDQMISMNESGDASRFQSTPSSRCVLSRDKRLPLDSWNTSGLKENVFGNQCSTFDSPRDHPEGIHSCATQREQGSVPQASGPGTLFTRDDKQNRGTIPMPTFARRPSTISSFPGGYSAEFYGWTAKTAEKRNCNLTNSLHILHSDVGR